VSVATDADPNGRDTQPQTTMPTTPSLANQKRTRMTRNIEKGLLPPQKLSGTLLAAMATVWNGLPEAIKSEQSETSTIIFLLQSAVTYNRDKFEV
jgi:hypothetical protein